VFRFHQPQETESEREQQAVCPRCGFTVAPRPGWLTARHCPRCRVRDRQTVPLVLAREDEEESAA
jgi:hypothetical protein